MRCFEYRPSKDPNGADIEMEDGDEGEQDGEQDGDVDMDDGQQG